MNLFSNTKFHATETLDAGIGEMNHYQRDTSNDSRPVHGLYVELSANAEIETGTEAAAFVQRLREAANQIERETSRLP